LTAIQINLSSIRKSLATHEDPVIRIRLEETVELVKTILAQVHEISVTLRPVTLDILGLLPVCGKVFVPCLARNPE